MFKRVERKRKRREEEEALGLDEDTKEIMGLNDTDSDESDPSSEHENAQSNDSDANAGAGQDIDQEGDAASEDEPVDEEPPISVAEVLKDPIYLISLDPTVHGCVLCKGKLIKNAGMAAAHKNANAHKRRFEHFRVVSVDGDLQSNAWEVVKSVHFVSCIQKAESREPSNRALKRQVKQGAIREKRKRRKDLKAKAIASRGLGNHPTNDETKPAVPSKVDLKSSPLSRIQSGETRKKQKLQAKTSTGTVVKSRAVIKDSVSHTKASGNSKKTDLKSRLKNARKNN